MGVSTGSGPGRWVTRVGSGTVLAGLLAGVPWALVVLAGWPLPRRIDYPRNFDQWEELVATPLTDQVIINALAVAMWLIWGAFALSVLGEVVAAVRGVPARRLPVISPFQRTAGWLVSGMTAGMLAAATFGPTVLMPPPAPPAISAPEVPTASAPIHLAGYTVPAAPDPATQADAAPPVLCAGEHVLVVDGRRYAYVVQEADSLWRIAELCLGDGAQWRAIWELNQGRRFPDVGGTMHDPDLIYPGWDLYLPAGAVPPPDAPEAAPPPAPPAPTAPPSAPEPPEPPESPSPEPAPPPSPQPSPSLPPPESSPAPTVPATTAPTSSATSAPPPSTGPAGVPAPPDAGSPADQADQPSTLVPIAFGAALIAATLAAAAAIKLRRRAASGDPRVGRPGHQLGHRPRHPGQGLPEQQLRAAAEPFDVDRLDTALRALAVGLANHTGPVPDVIAAHIADGDIHLLLTEASQPAVPPWRAHDTRWTLRREDGAPPPAGEALAALPTLVTVASRASGDGAATGGEHVLLDLERLGCLAIDGDKDAAYDLLRYLGSELAMNSWSDEVELILAGWDPDEAALLTRLNPDRTRVGGVSDTLAALRQRVRLAAGALTDAGAGDALAGRVHDLGGDSWMPAVLLLAHPGPDNLAAIADLAADLATVGRCAIAVVTVGEVPVRPDRPGAVHTITVTSGREAHVPFLEATLTAAGLPLAELETLAQVIESAREGQEEPVPAAPETEPWAWGTDAAGALLPEEELAPPAPAVPTARPEPAAGGRVESWAAAVVEEERRETADPNLDADLDAWRAPVADRPRIRILGPVTDALQVITSPGEPPKPGRLLLLAEVLVYLAQRGRRGADPHRLDSDLWPGQDVQVTYRRATLSRARQWAGRREDGSPWLAEIHYRLEEGYLLDWHLFRRLRARGQARGGAGVEDLRAALELVQGVPLAGYERIAASTRSPYSWLPTSDIDPEHLVAAIVDTAHELAQAYLAASDTAGAQWAVDRAWLADVDRNYDQPWLDLLRLQAMDGRDAELAVTVRELMRIREAEVEEDLDPAIYALLQEILPATFWEGARERVRSA